MRLAKWLVLCLMLSAFILLTAPVSADDPFGGPISKTSGDGSTTWRAIYIDHCTDLITYLPNSALWIKVEAWRNHTLQIALDDDPQDTAANFFLGTNSDQSPNLINGFWLKVYPPESLQPNYAYFDQQHRADLLTTSNGIRPDGSQVNFVGMANHNPFMPEHLLWYEGVFDGWVYLRVENKMPVNVKAMVCINHARYADDPPPPSDWQNEEPDPYHIVPADRRD